MSPRTGRPKSDSPRTTQLGVRFDKSELQKLDYLAKYLNTTRAGAIRASVEKTYSDIKKND